VSQGNFIYGGYYRNVDNIQSTVIISTISLGSKLDACLDVPKKVLKLLLLVKIFSKQCASIAASHFDVDMIISD
jgi:hypothetical protein